MKFNVLIVLLLTINSCNSIKTISDSEFVFREYGIYHQINLFDNSTFSFQINAGLRQINTSGIYKINSDTLSLRSFNKFRSKAEVSIDSVLSNNHDKNEIILKFINSTVKEVYCSFMNGEAQLNASNNQFEIQLDKGIDALEISFWGDTEIIEVPVSIPKENNKNVFYFNISVDEHTFYIDNKYKIYNRKIISLDDGITYKKQY